MWVRVQVRGNVRLSVRVTVSVRFKVSWRAKAVVCARIRLRVIEEEQQLTSPFILKS